MKSTSIILFILTMTSLAGCHSKSEDNDKQVEVNQKVRVETITAKANQPVTNLNYSGIIVPYMSTPLSFQLPGRVSNIYVDEGDVVKKGQILAELDKTTVESSYQMALAMQQQAQDAYDRLKSVYEKGSLPDIQWEEMKSKLQQANSSLMIAKQNVEHARISSPKNGIIGSRNTEIGSTATPGISVFDLLNIENVYVRISVPENEIRKIHIDQIAQVSIPALGTQLYEARVDKIGVVANLISKTYEVKLLLKNTGLIIKPGMACDINLKTESDDQAIALPFKAIGKDSNNQSYVYKIDQSSKKAIKQNVEVSGFINNDMIVSSGVKAGDVIVINGQQKLYDKAEVIY